MRIPAGGLFCEIRRPLPRGSPICPGEIHEGPGPPWMNIESRAFPKFPWKSYPEFPWRAPYMVSDRPSRGSSIRPAMLTGADREERFTHPHRRIWPTRASFRPTPAAKFPAAALCG